MTSKKITFAMAMDWEKGFVNGIQDDQDMEQFRSEKSVTIKKSPEEIKMLSVDESLGDLDRTCLLLTTGQDVQKVCVIQNMPELLKSQQMETLCRVIPKLCDLLPSASEEVQRAASCMLTDVVSEALLPIHIFITTLLQPILNQYQSKDPVISAVWLNTLLACIAALPKEEIKKRILTIAISKGQLSQTLASRQASCQILGEIIPRFEALWLKRDLLPLACSLCQDVDGQVRALMCQQLSTLAKSLGVNMAEASILPELIELLKDEETMVRIAALEVMVDLISFWSEPCVRKSVKPLLGSFCEAVTKTSDATILEGIARHLGKLCYEIKDYLSAEEVKWYTKIYCQLLDHPHQPTSLNSSNVTLSQSTLDSDYASKEITRLCAYNFPAIVVFVGSAGFKPLLLPVLDKLAKDEYDAVRKPIASGFHEVLKILGRDSNLVAGIYQSLLRDTSDEVLSGLVANLPASLTAFADAANLSSETLSPGLQEFISPLQACEHTASQNRQWRLQRDLVTNFRALVHCLTSDQIHTKFIPLLYRLISGQDALLPVKRAAAETLCLFIRHNRRQEQRGEICSWIVEECAKSSNCHKRMLFLEICQFVLDIFSRNFFKSNFFDPVLQMASDPVVNIRLRMCHLLPSLKSILKLPADRSLLQKLEHTVRRLITHERDSDACQHIRKAVLEMDRIEVAMESTSFHNAHMDTQNDHLQLTRQTYFEADVIDQKKEEEEQALIVAEEKEKSKEKVGGTNRPKVVISKTGKPCSGQMPSPSIGAASSPSIARRNNKSKGTGSPKLLPPSHSSEGPSNTSSPSHNLSIGKSIPRKKLSDSKSATGSPALDRALGGSSGRKKHTDIRTGSNSPAPDRLGGNLSFGTSHSNSSPSLRLTASKTPVKSPISTNNISSTPTRNKSPSTRRKSQEYGLEYAKPKKKT